MRPRRTYWHLEGRGRKPTDYEVATSYLLYYPEHGFDVRTPITDWYERYQAASALRCDDWDGFCDPRQTTYGRYTQLQNQKEIVLDGLLESIDASGYDAALSGECVRFLDRMLGPLRYPVHGLQMVAAYIGSMAPAGRIAIAASFQAADEMRRVQRLAYRTRQLQRVYPDFAQTSRERWERDALWQPLRRLVEELLVTYDWGEALVVLSLAVKPVFDEVCMIEFGKFAAKRGDDLLQQVFLSLFEDCLWHRAWSDALFEHVLAGRPDMSSVIEHWLDEWWPRVCEAVAGLSPLREFDGVSSAGVRAAERWERLNLRKERR